MQVEQVAVAVEALAEVVLTRFPPFQHRQATVAVRRSEHSMTMALWSLVDKFQQVSTRVVAIKLAIIGAGHGVIESSELWTFTGATRFPTRGFDQLRLAVVRVVIDRLDPLVGEVANRQRGILDAQHIAHRVVAVAQVLQDFVAALRLQADQAPVLRVVFQRGDHPIAGHFPFGLAVGVVGDGTDQCFRGGCAAELQVHLAQQAIEGLMEQLAVTLGIGLLDDFARRVEV
ncbi:hypothetical protein D3C76_1110680 [compost metagenome]